MGQDLQGSKLGQTSCTWQGAGGRKVQVPLESSLCSGLGTNSFPCCGAVATEPEGGFEADEVSKAMEANIKPVTLGKRILRTETAGMALLAIMMFQMQQ